MSLPRSDSSSVECISGHVTGVIILFTMSEIMSKVHQVYNFVLENGNNGILGKLEDSWEIFP
jgi:hypothetical protein